MRVQTPALVALAIFLAVLAYTIGDEGGVDPVTIYSRSGIETGLWHGESLPPDRWIGMILDSEAWGRLPIETGHVNIHSAANAPDFERAIGIIAYMGMMPTGGHEISVREVRYVPGDANALGRVTIRLDVTSPGPGDVVTQAFTNPVEAVHIARDRWPEGALDALRAGVIIVDAVDQDGRIWGPVHVAGTQSQ